MGIPVVSEVAADVVRKVLFSAGLVVLTVFTSRLARVRLRGALERGGFASNVAILLARLLWLAVWLTAFLILLSLFGIALTPLAALIGVLGLAASLSLQQVLQNLVAGVYLLAERPFRIGDVISVVGVAGLNHEGRVEDIQMRTTHLRSGDDELILVPNSAVFAGVVTNRTAVGGYANQLTVSWPREVEPDTVRQKVTPLLAQLPPVLSSPAPELRVDSAGKEDWTGCLVFWTASRHARSDVIWAIAQAFPEATVNNGATP